MSDLRESGQAWGVRTLAALMPKAKLTALTDDVRDELVAAIRTVAAHKAWAYGRAVAGVKAPTAGEVPRLWAAIGLLNHHLLELNEVPMRQDDGSLDPAVRANVDGKDGLEPLAPVAGVSGRSDGPVQEQLF